MYILYNINDQHVHQITEELPGSVEQNMHVMYAKTDKTVFSEESVTMPNESDPTLPGEVVQLPAEQTLPTSVSDFQLMLIEHLNRIFELDSESFTHLTKTYSSNAENRTYIVGLIVSGQNAVANGNTTWTATRVDLSGTPHQFTLTELIAFADSLEIAMSYKYTNLLTLTEAAQAETSLTNLRTMLLAATF